MICVDEGGCPSAGVVVVIGYISNKLCVVVCDATAEKWVLGFP